MSINRKSLSRIAAIQVMYSYEICKENLDVCVDVKLNEIIDLYKSKYMQDYYHGINKNETRIRLNINYLNELIKLTYENLSMIDQEISQFLREENTINDTIATILAILRVAFCEITYFKNIPEKVLISDYTDISAQMLDTKKTGFINSVLHNYQFQKKHQI